MCSHFVECVYVLKHLVKISLYKIIKYILSYLMFTARVRTTCMLTQKLELLIKNREEISRGIWEHATPENVESRD